MVLWNQLGGTLVFKDRLRLGLLLLLLGSEPVIVGLGVWLVCTRPPRFMQLILALLHILLGVGIINLGHVGPCLLIVSVGDVATLGSLHLELVQILNHIPLYFCLSGGWF